MTQQPKEKSGVWIESMAPGYPDFYRVDGIVEHCPVYLSETVARALYTKLGALLGYCPEHEPCHEAEYPYKQCKHCGSTQPWSKP